MPNLLLQDFNPDWEMLRNQKQKLLEDIEKIEFTEENNYAEKVEITQGVINLLDYIQDQAIQSGIWTEAEVFGEDKEDQYFQWEERYKPIINPFESRNGAFNDTLFETYGTELNCVLEYPHKNNIWTLIECDGNQYITAGYHVVNRLGYFITEDSWETGAEEFLNK